MFDLVDLVQATSEFMDRNAMKILESEDFMTLSADALHKLICRNSFCADEMQIFKGNELLGRITMSMITNYRTRSIFKLINIIVIL